MVATGLFLVTTTSQEVCRISMSNDVCVSQVTMIFIVILPYLTEESRTEESRTEESRT